MTKTTIQEIMQWAHEYDSLKGDRFAVHIAALAYEAGRCDQQEFCMGILKRLSHDAKKILSIGGNANDRS
jgi:hypothetical protein